MEKTKLILPCAGFGTRMGMEPTQSKELLLNPETQEPLIKWHLDNAYAHDLEPLVILRKEKKDLIKYCEENYVRYVVIEPQGEWSNSLLKAELDFNQFNDTNILAFPDTVYYEKDVLGQIKDELRATNNLTFGVFPVDDASKWCIVNELGVFEKCPILAGNYFTAIGLFGFTKEMGVKLFTSLHKTGSFELPASYSVNKVPLSIFRDLTRTGKIAY